MRAADPLRLLIILVVSLAFMGCTNHSFQQRSDEAVRFSLHQPDAEEVLFCSSLDGFLRHPASRDAQGMWSRQVHVDREIRYFFLADGRVVLPDCMMMADDDFGSKNCIYAPEM